MKRFFPVIFLASFAVFADDVETPVAPEAPEFVQDAEPIHATAKQSTGSLVDTILENMNQLVDSLNKAYKSSGLSKYVSKENAVMVTVMAAVSYVGYKRIKAYRSAKAAEPLAADDKKKD